jgi:DNA polymerase III subunit delta'
MQRILGQPRAIHILQATLRSGRIHHAWIFAGPPGVGKFTTALEFARILLDPNASPTLSGEIEADPDSRSSQLIDSQSHPDLHIIRKELALFSSDPQVRTRKLMNIPIDVIREWMIGGKDQSTTQAPVYRTAAMGRAKVFIIDEAELLDQYSQNAILKTLEEPPRQTYIILVTSRPDSLLPTIRSRCQFVPFVPLDAKSMEAWFRGNRESAGDSRQLAWLERFAEGSPGMAAIAAEYGFAAWQDELQPMFADLEQGRFPAAMGETMAKLADEFASRWVKNHDNASKLAANKAGSQYILATLARHVRDMLAHAAAAGKDPTPWMDVADLIRDAERAIFSNVNQKMTFENLAAQWASRLAAASASSPHAAV